MVMRETFNQRIRRMREDGNTSDEIIIGTIFADIDTLDPEQISGSLEDWVALIEDVDVNIMEVLERTYEPPHRPDTERIREIILFPKVQRDDYKIIINDNRLFGPWLEMRNRFTMLPLGVDEEGLRRRWVSGDKNEEYSDNI